MAKTNKAIFKAGGPLSAEDEKVYIRRQADVDLHQALQRMDYVLVIDARQQGKTSLVMHTMRSLSETNLVFAYIDVSTLDNNNPKAWYAMLFARMAKQLEKVVNGSNSDLAPENSYQWRDYLANLALLAVKAEKKIVVILDEVGAINFSESDLFFAVLREIFNSRGLEKHFERLTFVLVGVFDPGDLIRDPRVSPFNIAHPIHLMDFTQPQIFQLVSKAWPAETGKQLAARIYHWTDGQPYLTQALCKYLSPNSSVNDVDIYVEHLCADDSLHLPGIFTRLQSSPELKNYLSKITNKKVKFNPEWNPKQKTLKLLGLVKADENGNLKIRNRVYSMIIAHLEDGSNKTKITHSVENDLATPIQIQHETDENQLFPKSLIAVLLIFTVTIAVLVWAARQVSVLALLLILIVGLVFNLLFIVTVLAINGILPKKWSMRLYEIILSKIPILDFSKYFTKDNSHNGT